MTEKVDYVLFLLFAGMLMFAGLLFVCDVWFKDDAQLFQVIAGLLTGFSGSFFTRLKPKEPTVIPPTSLTSTVQETTVSKTVVPPPPEEERKEKLND